MQIAADVVLVGILVAASVTDLRTGRIRNTLAVPAIALGLLLAGLAGLASGGWAGAQAQLANHALGAAVAFVVMFVCFSLGGIGGGDVKLMTAVGAFLGWSRADAGLLTPYALFYAFAVGAILGLLAALWRGQMGVTAVRTWWGVRMLLAGQPMGDAVPKTSIKVPFGFATAVGTLWLLAENYAGVTLGQAIGLS